MANHDDDAHSLLFLDYFLAAREEDEAVTEDFYEASTDVEDEEVGAESNYAEAEEEGEGGPAEEGQEQDADGIPPQEVSATKHNHRPTPKVSACFCSEG